MQITIVAIGEVETKKSAKGTAYSTFEVTYKSDGQTRSKKLMSFDKPPYTALKDAQAGEVYDVGLVKDGEFWKWTTVTKAGATTSGSADAPKAQGGTTPSKGTWETHEERALKQLYITRSVALAQAVACFTSTNSISSKFDDSDVLSVANRFEQWLLIPAHGTPPSMDETLDETEGVM
jgi:hypothetical protein